MNEPVITCPNCSTEIKLTESLAAPLVESTRRQYEQRLAQAAREMEKRETDLLKQHELVARERESIGEKVAAGVNAERARIAAEEGRKVKLAMQAEMDGKARELIELQAVLKQRDVKLAEAQKAQAELIRKERELDDAKREMELTVEKRVQESLTAVRDKARKDVEDELKLKVAEKEQTITAMQRQIEELKRKAEQGSQQLQGEVLEMELEGLLRTKFPTDLIEPVAKGVWRRCPPSRHRAGRTGVRNDSVGVETDEELERRLMAKLRDDQRAKAERR